MEAPRRILICEQSLDILISSTSPFVILQVSTQVAYHKRIRVNIRVRKGAIRMTFNSTMIRYSIHSVLVANQLVRKHLLPSCIDVDASFVRFCFSGKYWITGCSFRDREMILE
jgi:hypothetical protein